MRQGIQYTRVPGIHTDTIFIRSVYVNPKNRGKGVARKMLENFLDTHRASHIILEAYPFDAGGPDAEALMMFYQTLGFTRLNGSPLYLMYKGPG